MKHSTKCTNQAKIHHTDVRSKQGAQFFTDGEEIQLAVHSDDKGVNVVLCRDCNKAYYNGAIANTLASKMEARFPEDAVTPVSYTVLPGKPKAVKTAKSELANTLATAHAEDFPSLQDGLNSKKSAAPSAKDGRCNDVTIPLPAEVKMATLT